MEKKVIILRRSAEKYSKRGRSVPLTTNRLAQSGEYWRETSANNLSSFFSFFLPPPFSLSRFSFPHQSAGFLRRNAKHLHSRGRPTHRSLVCMVHTYIYENHFPNQFLKLFIETNLVIVSY